MKKLLYPTVFLLVLNSCGGDSTIESTDKDSSNVAQIDTLKQISTLNLDSLFGNQFEVKTTLPYKIDSIYFENLDITQKQLTSDQVKFLSDNLAETDFSYSAKSNVEDVLFFDSLKVNDGYEEYMEILDIGMMKDTTAHAVCEIEVDSSTKFFVWYIDYGTYEACPYFAGKSVYLSTLKNGTITSCNLIAEFSGGGDAPYWSENLITAEIGENKIAITKSDRNGGDTDEEGNELIDESLLRFELSLNADGTWTTTEIKK